MAKYLSMINWSAIVGILVVGLVGLGVWLWLSKRKKPIHPDIESHVILEDGPAEPVIVGSDGVVEGQVREIKEPPPEGKYRALIPEGKYRALIIVESGKWHFGKIPEPCGHVFTCDTTMPETGDHYLVKLINGKYEAYDPRIESIISNDTPEIAYWKTQDWEPDIPYVDEIGLLEKLPAILAYCLMGFTCIFVLVLAGK